MAKIRLYYWGLAVHPFTESEAPPKGRALRVRFRDVVSAKTLYNMGGKRPPHRVAIFKAGMSLHEIDV
jgi:hypothetical protein